MMDCDALVLACCWHSLQKTGRKEKLPKELQCGALFGERRKDIFSESEILSALQEYLFPVKRCLHFSAESPWICLEAVIHND